MKITLLLLFGTMIGVVSGSENGLLYECDAARLTTDNECHFVATSSNMIGASPHNLDRSVAANGFRAVANAAGTAYSVTPAPWTQGDRLVSVPAALTGDELAYSLAFELVAPLRDAMMYNPSSVTSSPSEWAKLTRAFTDCQVKTANVVDGMITIFGTDGVYEVLKSPNTQTGPPVHNFILQYLEEGAIDLVCAMTSSFTFERCDAVRASLGVTAGTASTCWEGAYTALYGTAAPPTSSSAPPSAPSPSGASAGTTQQATPSGQVPSESGGSDNVGWIVAISVVVVVIFVLAIVVVVITATCLVLRYRRAKLAEREFDPGYPDAHMDVEFADGICGPPPPSIDVPDFAPTPDVDVGPSAL